MGKVSHNFATNIDKIDIMTDSLRKSIEQKMAGLNEASLREALSKWLNNSDLSSQSLEAQLKKTLAQEFKQLSHKIAQEAQNNGLTPEILQNILDQEKEERIKQAQGNASRH